MPSSDADTGPLDLRDIAVRIAEEAAAHVRARRPEVFGASGAARMPEAADAVQVKSSPTDPVTVVDTETEQLIRALLARLRPDDAVLGEEGGGSTAAPAGVRWVVDPIDGTVNFLYGIPAYAVSVAAQVDGRSVAGAVVDVAFEITYSAALGHGATRRSRDGVETPLQASTVDSVAFALVATGFGYGAHLREEQGRMVAALLPRVRDIRRIGSAALDLCMVAAGLVDAHYEHGLSPWDWAAGSLIATEAGATVYAPDPTASSTDGQVLVACAPGIAAELHAMLDELGVLTARPEG